MIALHRFISLTHDCGLTVLDRNALYRLLRKSAILIKLNPAGSARDREKTDRQIQSLLGAAKECAFLKTALLNKLRADEIDISTQAREKKYSPHLKARTILNHRAELYASFLKWDSDDEQRLVIIRTRLESRRQKISDKRKWRYGILGGVTAALASSAYFYLRHQKNKEGTR